MARKVTAQPHAFSAASVLALAIGALAIGRLAVGRVVIKKASFGALEVDELTVRRLRVVENVVEPREEVSERAPTRTPIPVPLA